MNIAINTVGVGPHLLLLHGWGMSSSIWNLSLADLQKKYQVSAVDLPGHGQNHHQGNWGIDEFVDALAERMPAQSIVLGWSLGGMVALRLASRHPSRVSKLILLASSAKFVRSRDWLYAQPKAVLTMFAEKLSENPRATLKRFLLLQTQGVENQTGLSKLIKQIIVDDRLPSQEGLASGLNVLKLVDLRDELKKLACPVLQILGERDQLVPVGVGLDSKEINPAIQTTVIEGAAHVPFLSHPVETLQSIDRFCLA